jgi:DNA-binding response OmpR family regulator
VLSGRAGDADRVRSFARGADDHLNKPFLYAELLGSISSFGSNPLSGFSSRCEWACAGRADAAARGRRAPIRALVDALGVRAALDRARAA